jgi:flagellar motor component MotA
MIGTLIGMVQMFANMTYPSKLGPFMAVAVKGCQQCRPTAASRSP